METKSLHIGGHIPISSSGDIPSLLPGITNDTTFQCFLHSRQAHYTEARVNKWKLSKIHFAGDTPRMVHASYVTFPWSVKQDTRQKSILDIRYTSEAANLLNIQYLNVHLSKELYLVPEFEKSIADCLVALAPPCTLLFENVGNLPAPDRKSVV